MSQCYEKVSDTVILTTKLKSNNSANEEWIPENLQMWPMWLHSTVHLRLYKLFLLNYLVSRTSRSRGLTSPLYVWCHQHNTKKWHRVEHFLSIPPINRCCNKISGSIYIYLKLNKINSIEWFKFNLTKITIWNWRIIKKRRQV